MAKMWKKQQVEGEGEDNSEKDPEAEEATLPPSDMDSAPPEDPQDSDRNAAAASEPEKTYDVRDDDDESSSDSEEAKESRGSEGDKD